MVDVTIAIAAIGAIMLLGFLGEFIFRKTDIPNTIWLLIFGLIIGNFLTLAEKDALLSMSQYIAAIAVIVILFDSGINTELYQLFKGAPRGLILMLCEFLFSVLVTTMVMVLLGNTLISGVLLGAIIGGTCSATVIPIAMRLKNLQPQTRIMLEIESALNDILCIVVVFAIMYTMTTSSGIDIAAKSLISTFSIGAVLGLVVGIAWLPIMHRIKKENFAYVVTLGLLFLLYAGASIVAGEIGGTGAGALACIAFGIVLGNGDKILRIMRYKNKGFEIDKTTKQFHELVTFFIRTFFFVYLGIIVNLQDALLIAIGIVLTLCLMAARPISVYIATYRGNFDKTNYQIMMMLMPRGLTAAVLSYFVLAQNLPMTNGFVDITFSVIVTSVIISTVGISIIEYREKCKQKRVKNAKSQNT